MKRILRIFIIESFTLYLVSQITTGLTFQNGPLDIILTGIALTIASLIVKPIINLLLLPLTLLTFGFFRFLTNVIMLFLVDLVLTQFSVGAFFFKGYDAKLIIIPSIRFPAGPLSYLGFSLLISFISSVIYWLLN